MTNPILITGADGLVGSRFVELFPNPELLLCPSLADLDITSASQVKNYLQIHSPSVIINFAAFTDVSSAENQRGQKNMSCWQVNTVGVQNLLSSIDSARVHFIQISTDMVFPGSSLYPGPYAETDLPEINPNVLTWYGFTKAEAERLIDVSRASLLRLTNPVRANYVAKLDYFHKPLSLYDAGKLYPLFSDQQISITFIDEACLALQKIISNHHFGIFHAASSNLTTPVEIITYFLQCTRKLSSPLTTSSIDSVSNPIRYPKYGGLKVASTQKILNLKFSSSQAIVDQIVARL